MSKLECDGVSLRFDLRQILGNIYLKCHTGEIVGLLGRNGAGKSCLMNIIFGTLKAESQSVRIDNSPVNNPFAKDIAYLPQYRFIPSFLTIRDAFKIYKVNPDAIQKYFPELYNQLTLKPFQMSGGALRIFEILLVTGISAKFILLDEPFSGLTPIHIEQVKCYLNEAKTDKGIIMTDHLYRHVTMIADKLYLLANGQDYQIKNEEQLMRYGYISSL